MANPNPNEISNSCFRYNDHSLNFILIFGFYLTDVEMHPEIRKHFWDVEHWPKHILVRYTWLVLFCFS